MTGPQAWHRRSQARAWLRALSKWPWLALILASSDCAKKDAGPTEPPPTRPPNMIVFMVDTLRADELACYGAKVTRTPAIDAFAREGTLFTDASSPASSTRPAVASLLTGVAPYVHGAESLRTSLSDDAGTLVRLPELLQARGYFTGGIVANPNVSSVFGFRKGFDVYEELYAPRTSTRPASPLDLVSDAASVTRAIRSFVESAPLDKPYFLFVLSIDPHAPYTPPPPYDSLYDKDAVGERDGSLHAVLAFDQLLETENPPSPDRIRALYRGEATYLDEHFGQLIEWLRETGRLDEAAVMFTADHGEEFVEHGGRGHGKTVYEEVTHVPLIIRYPPAFEAGARRTEPVDLLDLSATALGLAGLHAPGYWEGRYLREPVELRPVFTTNNKLRYNQAAVRLGGLKIIIDRIAGTTTVYNLPYDPGEQQPLSGNARAQAEARLVPLFQGFEARSRELHEQIVRGELQIDPENLPADVLESLRSLGYVK